MGCSSRGVLDRPVRTGVLRAKGAAPPGSQGSGALRPVENPPAADQNPWQLGPLLGNRTGRWIPLVAPLSESQNCGSAFGPERNPCQGRHGGRTTARRTPASPHAGRLEPDGSPHAGLSRRARLSDPPGGGRLAFAHAGLSRAARLPDLLSDRLVSDLCLWVRCGAQVRRPRPRPSGAHALPAPTVARRAHALPAAAAACRQKSAPSCAGS